jgi:hypothetical protein
MPSVHNRIHLDTQSRGVLRFLQFQHKTSFLPSPHWLWAQVGLVAAYKLKAW